MTFATEFISIHFWLTVRRFVAVFVDFLPVNVFFVVRFGQVIQKGQRLHVS